MSSPGILSLFLMIFIVVVFVATVIILWDVSTLLKLKIKQNQVKLKAMMKETQS